MGFNSGFKGLSWTEWHISMGYRVVTLRNQSALFLAIHNGTWPLKISKARQNSGSPYDGFIYFLWRCDPTRVMASSFLMFLDHTQRRITVGMTPLDEWLARRRDLYLTTHNTHNRQTSTSPVGFEPTISAGERPQTYALDRAATGTGP